MELGKKIFKIYDKIFFIIEFLFSIVLSISLWKILYINKYTELIPIKWTVIFTIILISLITIIIINFIRYKDKIEKIFISILIPLGILYLIFIIPNGVPDENAHIKRIYDISQGNVYTPIRDDGKSDISIPNSFIEKDIDKVYTYKLLHDELYEKTDYESTTYSFSGAQAYSASMYIPSSFVFFIAKKISLNYFITIYIARIINLIIFLICAYLTVKIVPFGKILFAVYLCTPMILQQASSLSADSLINSILLLFIAYNIFLFKNENIITTKKKILYFIFCIFLGTAKYAYFPIIGISLICINSKQLQRIDKKKIVLTSVLSVLFLTVFTYVISMRYPESEYLVQCNVNSKLQCIYIMKHPITYFLIFIKTVQKSIEIYINTFLGQQLGLLNIGVKQFEIWILALLMIFAPFIEKNEKHFNRKEKLILVSIFLLSFVIILTGLYLTWCSVGSTEITGVQGRYFIPILILPLLCLIDKKNYVQFKNINVIYFVTLMYINISAISSVIKFYLI